ncbi:uncharacterized protein LOC128676848 [Plodia interpunctella]|uniref:uncharacterized protein LOC128676848 n=1 Tax=Plodia interpunctella TaxID=58824 RepID=UPI002368A80B|nr:uncharacterized protein LOC128676848 isoform X2 [Plodia interpunctella]
MAKLATTVALMALLAIGISAIPGKRLRRGFNNSGYGTSQYGRGSDERDNSSQEGNGCSSENSRSREFSFDRNGRQSDNNRGTRSFAKASASAAATAYNQNHGSKNFVL